MKPVQLQGPDPARKAWVIFAICVLLAAMGIAFFVQQGLRDYRVFNSYQPAQCTVTGKGVLTSTMNAGTGRLRHPMTTYAPQYVFEYEVNGKHITAVGSDNLDGVIGVGGIFNVGGTYPCWYDPADPGEAVLERIFSPKFYSAALIPLVFLLIAGSFLLRALGPKQAIGLADGGRGNVLAVRLVPELSRSSTLVSLVVVFVAFTSALLGALLWAVQDWTRLWDFGFFLLLAIGAEVWLVRFTLSAVKAMNIPDPVVEIDHEPLKRGDKMKVSVRQQGPAHFDIFRIAVVCERTGGQGGKGSGRENQKILTVKKDLDIREQPFASVLESAIDADAPASDKTLQMNITWKVVVKRTKKGLLGLDREYVFRVV